MHLQAIIKKRINLLNNINYKTERKCKNQMVRQLTKQSGVWTQLKERLEARGLCLV
jgi:hypothetical protein